MDGRSQTGDELTVAGADHESRTGARIEIGVCAAYRFLKTASPLPIR